MLASIFFPVDFYPEGKPTIYYPKGIWCDFVPVPVVEGGEALVRVELTGFCGTDFKRLTGVIPTGGPVVVGHEIVGTIVKVGSNVADVKAGDRVVVFHHVPCTSCYYCEVKQFDQCVEYKSVDTTAGVGKPQGGGFAEFVKLPRQVVERGLVKIPEHVPFDEAVYAEPLNCCFKAVRLAEVQEGEQVIVIGQGSIGLLVTQLLVLKGARVIALDASKLRLELSESFGALAFNVRDAKQLAAFEALLQRSPVAKTIVASNSVSALESAVRWTAGGGLIVELGDVMASSSARASSLLSALNRKSLRYVSSYSSDFEFHEESTRLIFERKVDVRRLTTHVLPLSDVEAAVFLACVGGDEAKLKMLERVSKRHPVLNLPRAVGVWLSRFNGFRSEVEFDTRAGLRPFVPPLKTLISPRIPCAHHVFKPTRFPRPSC